MNDTTSPKHPPLSHDQAPPGASHAQCGGGHAECFERLRDSIVSWFIDNFGTGNVTVIPPGARLLVHLPPDAMDRSFEQLKNCMAPPTTMADESERIVAKEALRRLALAATAGSKT